MQPWQLPEYIADILPVRAQRIEYARQTLLCLYTKYGYALVQPPLMEYTESLLTNKDSGLALKTIRIVDQLSGHQLGLRADTTPQIARIDAHLLAHKSGVNRLCYIGNTIHARPDTLLSTREPLQIGAELYGCDTIESDIELIDLMLKSLNYIGIQSVTLTLGHLNIFQSIIQTYNIDNEDEQKIRTLLDHKNYNALLCFCRSHRLPEHIATLAKLYGYPAILNQAQNILPKHPNIQAALDHLQQVIQTLNTYGINDIHIDLAKLRADRYHTGLLFSAYAPNFSSAIASGGRYNGLGAYFGRNRPAVGFSFDLKNFVEVLPQPEYQPGICVAVQDWSLARNYIEKLRQNGETVVINYLDESPANLNCDRRLEKDANGQWVVVAI